MSKSLAWTAFWQAYHADRKSERPTLFQREDHPGVGVSIESIFDATVRMCDQFRAMPRSDRFMFPMIRFYIDGQRIADPSEYLMDRRDGAFGGWHNRLQAMTNDYFVLFNHLESTFGEDIAGIYELLHPLVGELGLPARQSEVTLFAGRYKKTPFGIHTDDELNFYWPVIGAKRMRFWSPDYGGGQAAIGRLLEYDEHLSESLLVDAQVGDMIAWPGSWWHIAEGSDEFSVSLTIPLAWYPLKVKIEPGQLSQKLAKFLLGVAAAQSGSTLMPLRMEEDTSETIPEMIVAAARLFSEIRPEDISDYLTEQWLRKITTAGLEISRVFCNDFAIDEAQTIRCGTAGSIRWARLSRGKMCVASGGHSIVLPDSAAVVEIIGQLNTANPFTVGSLITHVASTCSDRSPSAVTKFVLTMLAKMGAVELAAEHVHTAGVGGHGTSLA